MGRRFAFAAAVLAMLPGCAPADPNVFAIAPQEAYRRLAASRFEEMRFAHQCGILVHFHPSGIASRSVTWRVLSSGVEMLSFTVNLFPVEGDRTRIEIEVGRERDGAEGYDGTRFYARPALRQPIRPAIREQVAALLESRPYDVMRTRREREPTPGREDVFTSRQPGERDRVCDIQRAVLEQGRPFNVRDIRGASIGRPRKQDEGRIGS